MNKEKVVEELLKFEVDFNKDDTKKELIPVLEEKYKEILKEKGIDFDESADVDVLFKMIETLDKQDDDVEVNDEVTVSDELKIEFKKGFPRKKEKEEYKPTKKGGQASNIECMRQLLGKRFDGKKD